MSKFRQIWSHWANIDDLEGKKAFWKITFPRAHKSGRQLWAQILALAAFLKWIKLREINFAEEISDRMKDFSR